MNVRVEEVVFGSEGVDCAGTLFMPADTTGPLPGLVMGNGFANVRRMYLPAYAAAFAAAGMSVLTVDYRYLGESGGRPRQQVLPEAQCDDLRNALTWLSERPEVDAGRMGLWGTSFGGGHAMRVAALDRRVAAVVAQVPAIGLWRYFRRNEPAVRERFLASALADRLAYARTGEPRPLAITAEEGIESILGPDGLDWHRRNEREHDTFHNWITGHSLDRIVPYDPGAFVEDISPVPLLMILMDADTTTPSEVAREVYDRAKEPKQLLELVGGHYDVYDLPSVREACVDATIGFLVEHLSATT
ncbi:alpha/beta hydrolase [Streptosporangium sp. DT93]|uniref:alpha/beta hydrolase n=1 Tax=Streptosporangium sp. DT93 TaxID=3393428 RepID=UPI003CF00D9A